MDKVRCSNCGKNIFKGLQFCPYCGEKQAKPLSQSDLQKDPYQILQVSRNAEPEVIKSAYKSLAKKYHPDNQVAGLSDQKMKDVNWAYKILSDPEKRKLWNNQSKNKQRPKQSAPRTNYKKKTEKTSSYKPKTSYKPDKTRKISDPLSGWKKTAGLLLAMFAIAIIIAISNSGDRTSHQNSNSSSQKSTKLNTPIPANSPKNDWPLELSEGFNTNNSLWSTGDFYDADLGNTSKEISGGKYQWQSEAYDEFVSTTFPNINPISDFYLSVKARQISGSQEASYGIVFRSSEKGEYIFLISGEYYALFHYDGIKYHPLIDWARNIALKTKRINHVEVTAEGPKIIISVNDKTIITKHDNNLEEGHIGLAIQLFEEGDQANFEFDDFELRSSPSIAYSLNPVKTNSETIKPRACVHASTLYVRTGPGTDFPSKSYLERGKCFEIISKTEDYNWLKIDLGWVSANYMNFVEGDINDVPVNNGY